MYTIIFSAPPFPTSLHSHLDSAVAPHHPPLLPLLPSPVCPMNSCQFDLLKIQKGMENSYKTPAKLLIRRCKFRLDLGLFALVLTWLLAPLPPSPITFLSRHPGHTKLQPHLHGLSFLLCTCLELDHALATFMFLRPSSSRASKG